MKRSPLVLTAFLIGIGLSGQDKIEEKRVPFKPRQANGLTTITATSGNVVCSFHNPMYADVKVSCQVGGVTELMLDYNTGFNLAPDQGSFTPNANRISWKLWQKPTGVINYEFTTTNGNTQSGTF